MEKIGKNDDTYKNIMCIYKIINNITGKVYIGSTINLKQRINRHFSQLNLNTHPNPELQKDWNKYKSDSFIFELIEKVNDVTLLPEIEQKFIDLYRMEKSIYNISNPIEEFNKRKLNKPKKNKGKKGKSKVTFVFIKEYLNENYDELFNRMKDEIGKRKYFYKDKVDKWIIDDIKNEDVKNDGRLIDALQKIYNKKLNFAVIKSNMYKREFKELFGLDIDSNRELLVSNEINSELYNKKISKFRKN